MVFQELDTPRMLEETTSFKQSKKRTQKINMSILMSHKS